MLGAYMEGLGKAHDYHVPWFISSQCDKIYTPSRYRKPPDWNTEVTKEVLDALNHGKEKNPSLPT